MIERTPGVPDGSIATGAIRLAMIGLWNDLTVLSELSAPGTLGLVGRALGRTPSSAPATGSPNPSFMAALGALWDALPASPETLAPGEFYRNGNALERAA